jgi:hypothetical protein
VGTQLGSILIWPTTQLDRKEPRLRLPGHRGLISSLVFDRRGRRLAGAVGTDPLVEIRDLELIGRELMQLRLAN